jgi:hypothetical protein
MADRLRDEFRGRSRSDLATGDRRLEENGMGAC